MAVVAGTVAAAWWVAFNAGVAPTLPVNDPPISASPGSLSMMSAALLVLAAVAVAGLVWCFFSFRPGRVLGLGPSLLETMRVDPAGVSASVLVKTIGPAFAAMLFADAT